jgi:hypothetical protein
MYSLSHQKPEFSSKHKRILRRLVIGEGGLGTILSDFEAVLAFLRERDLPVTGQHQLSYPHINRLYLLVRASGLTYIGGTAKEPLDYGDSWTFDVTLEGVDPDMAIEGPVILETHGQPPEQCPSWDD